MVFSPSFSRLVKMLPGLAVAICFQATTQLLLFVFLEKV
jgi:hypothetical protein